MKHGGTVAVLFLGLSAPALTALAREAPPPAESQPTPEPATEAPPETTPLPAQPPPLAPLTAQPAAAPAAPTPPTPQPPAAPAASAAPVRDQPRPGPWFGGVVGVGGPYGADTATGSADFKQGWGALASAGYAFVPNFGIGAFFHYNRTALEFHDRYGYRDVDENSGYVLLYGLEARGIVGSGFMLGYASLGVALGSGSLALSRTGGSEWGPGGYTRDETDSVSFNPMPVLGFGVEAKISGELSLGPMLRWYLVSAKEACSDVSESQGGTQVSAEDCVQDFSDVNLPDILFVGAGLTYRL